MRYVAIYINVLMSFGLGILFNHCLSDSGWDKPSVALGLVLVFCGAVYGSALGFHLWWRLRTERRPIGGIEGDIP
jgi:uncharacterized membrane protein YgdD (TMEM256/DUF423 family)